MYFSRTAALAGLSVLGLWILDANYDARPKNRQRRAVAASDTKEDLLLTWRGDEVIEVAISKHRGLFQAPLRIKVNDRTISLGGIYVHINEQKEGFTVESTVARLRDARIEVTHVLRHPKLAEPTSVRAELWMEPQDRGLRSAHRGRRKRSALGSTRVGRPRGGPARSGANVLRADVRVGQATGF